MGSYISHVQLSSNIVEQEATDRICRNGGLCSGFVLPCACLGCSVSKDVS